MEIKCPSSSKALKIIIGEKNFGISDSKHRFLASFIITFGGISVWFYYGTSVEALLSLRNLESNSYNGELPHIICDILYIKTIRMFNSVTEVLNVYNWKNTSWNDRSAQYFFKSYENLNFTDGEQGMSDLNKKLLNSDIIFSFGELNL